MEDNIHLGRHVGDDPLVEDRIDDVVEIGIALEMSDVFETAGRQVVNDRDLVAPLEERFDEMRTDETGTAGDEHLH